MKNIAVILRVYALPASVIPVLAGTAIAFKYGSFSTTLFLLTLVAAFMIHSGANLANTYFDHKNGVDRPDSSDDRAILDGLITARGAIALTLSLFAGGCSIGLYIAARQELPHLLWIGAAGAALGWFYTAGTVRYKYRALGEAGIFAAFGPLIVAGTALIQTGELLPSALSASVPLGSLVAAIVHANNMRDIKTDGDSGIKTLAGAAGLERSKTIYDILVFAPYLLTLPSGPAPFAAAFISLPFAIKLRSAAARGDFGALVGKTAGFVVIFGICFIGGILLP